MQDTHTRTPITIPEFRNLHTLSGHTRAVNVLAMSLDSAFLLSGADDSALIIWDVLSGHLVQSIDVRFHGQLQTALWLYTDIDRVATGFIFGCADGTVHHYKKEPASVQFNCAAVEKPPAGRGGVEALAFDPFNSHVATARGGMIELWSVESRDLKLLHSNRTEDVLISSLFFIEQGTVLVISYLESHEVVAYQTMPWKEQWRRTLRTRLWVFSSRISDVIDTIDTIFSGFCVPGADTMLVSNLEDGVDVYTLPPTRLIRTHRHSTEENYRLQLATFSEGSFAVGSATGTIPLYDQAGHLCQTISHGTLPVTTLTSSQLGGTSYLVSAASTFPFDIKIWAAASTLAHGQPVVAEHGPQSLSFRQFLILMFLCGATQWLLSNLQTVHNAMLRLTQLA
ncbi:WD40 repeat-like protein [Coprinellus micaceus]|uniref:WD40 repeat-like protein n=1 Tax=Coprinellus micaceus TaxID=71717 RepID=A0A4Y7TXA0_COPMI|nr:WD40 repeat-like protein [Coprinellus micaceus]